MPGGKIGGIADVAHDLPLALAPLGWNTTIVTPSYGAFHKLRGAERLDTIEVRFRGGTEAVEIYEVPGNNAPVRNLVFEHADFSPQGPGRIYCSDPGDSPFATDAGKFALFNAALAEWLVGTDTMPDVVHLQDWHTGFYFLLREFDARFEALKSVRSVFTIHNLAYQGTRPLAGNASSLDAWFPGLDVDEARVGDPRYADCVNPMACAVRLADKVHTVSPTYAGEICEPSDPAKGFIGGEGLEDELRTRRDDGELIGILNGCEYPERRGRKPAWTGVVDLMREQADAWLERGDDSGVHALAAERLAGLPRKKPNHIMVSVGRLVDQKVSLFLTRLPDGRTALEHILDDPGRLLVFLGSGDGALEQEVRDVAQRTENLIFLRGYSETLAAPLYRSGDLFLMPSSFEPCGISQLLSLRAGVPCVVHGVGGLRDTIEDGRTGFIFEGGDPLEQATNFVATVGKALHLRTSDPDSWNAMRRAAAAARFDWARSARETIEKLYDT